ncbi:hypothetical protein HUT18_06480 [Streptomyces sp. NA04227]|uniref:hypothetical protein n=1 Tax=Streptomyces sp. NA04227 TaxID=2742136 RepID=UPI00158FD936|nr:hypothetical protein [Streptomyces sp. NA04227]QKW06100.1 hypothetical protein HUT18_06480 [Streptomyces sp. NA04227]
MTDWYTRTIVDPGKQPLLIMLVAFIVAFLFIRLSVRMIRAEVSWWPGNIEGEGFHLHHVVFGIVFMVVAGFGLVSPFGSERPWTEILAGLFGVGTALVLDEFALVLHLEDVYWTGEGRLSVDAVVLGAALAGLLLIGAAPFGVNEDTARGSPVVGWDALSTILVNGALAVIALTKGKVFTGLIGLLLPVFALVGAIRLARPGSPWARRRYPEGSKKALRAERRETREDWMRRMRVAAYNAIAGKPSAQ